MRLRILPLEKGENANQEKMDLNLVNVIRGEWTYLSYGPAQERVRDIVCKAYHGVLNGQGREDLIKKIETFEILNY